MCLWLSWLTPWTGHSRRSAGRPSWPVAWSSAPAAVDCPVPLSCISPPDPCTSAVGPGAHPSTSTNIERKQYHSQMEKKILKFSSKRINWQDKKTATIRKRKQQLIQSTFCLRHLAGLRVIKLRKAHPWSQSLTTKGTCSGKVEQR